jgi:hypothetical protein
MPYADADRNIKASLQHKPEGSTPENAPVPEPTGPGVQGVSASVVGYIGHMFKVLLDSIYNLARTHSQNQSAVLDQLVDIRKLLKSEHIDAADNTQSQEQPVSEEDGEGEADETDEPLCRSDPECATFLVSYQTAHYAEPSLTVKQKYVRLHTKTLLNITDTAYLLNAQCTFSDEEAELWQVQSPDRPSITAENFRFNLTRDRNHIINEEAAHIFALDFIAKVGEGWYSHHEPAECFMEVLVVTKVFYKHMKHLKACFAELSALSHPVTFPTLFNPFPMHSDTSRHIPTFLIHT